MIGYWNPACPVRTGRDDVLATAYVREGKALVAVASWAKEPVRCRLELDWKALGLRAEKAHLFAPAIERFQPPRLFQPSDRILVAPGRGCLLIVDEEEHKLPERVAIDVYKGRALLLEERFDKAKLGEPWTVQQSGKHKTALKVEKGGVAIEAPANVCAFAERALPKGTTLVECEVWSGSDNGASWGPGIALVWPKAAFRINLRAPEARLGADHPGTQAFGGYALRDTWHQLRIRLEPDRVVAESSHDGDWWETVHTAPRTAFPGDPAAVRIGKMSPGSRNEDHHVPGPVGSCAIRRVRVWGRKP